MTPHAFPPLPGDILNKISDYAEFVEFVRGGYKQEAEKAYLEPRFSDDLFHDAHQSYLWDIERLENNMHTSPDHFKQCGHLAYWLRRNSPVLSWDKQRDDCDLGQEQKECRRFILDFGRAFHAFALGYHICWSIERNKEKAFPMPPNLSHKRLTHICYYMKYKSVSPHAMGLIYESLFPE